MSDDMSMGLPSSAGEHGVLRSMQEVAIYLAAEANPGQWSVPIQAWIGYNRRYPQNCK